MIRLRSGALAAAMRRVGLDVGRLAYTVRLSRSDVAELLDGDEVQLSPDVRLRLSRALGVDEAALFVDANELRTPLAELERNASVAELRLPGARR